MNKDRKIEPSKITIVKLRTIRGRIDSPDHMSLVNGGHHQFTSDMHYGVNVEDKVVGIQLTVDINATWDNFPEVANASFTHELLFAVENLEDFVDIISGHEPDVDRIMLGTLIGIAYSTVRGIIYTRTQGTALQGALMPVIDPKQFVPEKITKDSVTQQSLNE